MDFPVEVALRQQANMGMQLKEDSSNIDKVKDFLEKSGVDFSLDEIRSAGQLIVYCTTGPAIMHPTDWVVITGMRVCYVLDNERFTARFDIRSLNDY